MHFIGLSLIMIWILHTYAFDPDEDICENTVLDSSVNSADGNTYIFKGDFYWKTSQLDSERGIEGYADHIKNKWPEIDEPLIASFIINAQTLLTILVYKNKWIAYDSTGMVLKGNTNKWPEFENLNLNTMFSTNLLKNEIFAIYDDSKHFHIYDFSDLSEPKILKSGITAVNDNFLWFIDNPNQKGIKTLKDLLKVKTSISYKQTLILLSDEFYCLVNLNSREYEKECWPQQRIYDLLGCPLDLSSRTTLESIESTLNNLLSEVTETSVASNSSEPLLNSSPIDSMTSENNLNTESKTQEEESKSNIIVVVIIVVIVAVIIAVIIGIMIVLFTKKSKTIKEQSVSVKSVASIQTVLSSNGAPVRSNSIASLQDAN